MYLYRYVWNHNKDLQNLNSLFSDIINVCQLPVSHLFLLDFWEGLHFMPVLLTSPQETRHLKLQRFICLTLKLTQNSASVCTLRIFTTRNNQKYHKCHCLHQISEVFIVYLIHNAM